MNKKVLAAAVIAVLVLGGGAYALFGMNNEEVSAPSTDTDSSSVTPATTTEATSPTAMQSEAVATITFTNDGFNPGTITVKKGTVVTVKNESSDRVQFSSDDHPTHREDPEINLKTIAPGESATFTPKTVGTHGFHDHIDDSKTGTLIVTE